MHTRIDLNIMEAVYMAFLSLHILIQAFILVDMLVEVIYIHIMFLLGPICIHVLFRQGPLYIHALFLQGHLFRLTTTHFIELLLQIMRE